MVKSKLLAIVFSGDLNQTGGTQSWAKTLKYNNLKIKYISLNCKKNNFHFPAFKSNNRTEFFDLVICCDPLSLIWASHNLNTSKLVIGVFHKDEWNLDKDNSFERYIINIFNSCAGVLIMSYLKINNLPESVKVVNLSFMPRQYFLDSKRIKFKGNNILILGRLEAFKGYPVYLIDLAKAIFDIDSKIKIHVVGKGTLYEDLKQDKIENMIFHGYLDEKGIYDIAKNCMLGVSSGLSAIELSTIGLPVAVSKEDSNEMILTCFTGNGNFIFQDDFINSEEINLLDVIKTVHLATKSNWDEYSKRASSICSNGDVLEILLNIKEVHRQKKHFNFILYFYYLLYIIMDLMQLKKFNFRHRIY